MSITDLIYLSQKSLRSNILRSILTSLGIIIGVSSVITMISIGSGARIEVEQQIERFGSNNLIVRSQSSSNRGVSMGANSVNTLTLKDMEALKEELPAIKAIAPRVSLSTQIVANGNNWLATVTGTTNDYFDLGNWKFENGRSFEEEELASGSRVAIIGKTVQKNLFDTDSPIDEVIRINKVPFTVIGLLDAKGGTAWADLDDTVIVPLKTAKQRLVAKKFPGDQIRSMTINVRSSDLLFKTEKDVDTVMRKLHKISANGNPDFVIRNYAQFLNARQESSRVMSILLATVAGISLIVGGIGIMNIMLVTVTERTKEIGVCMSVGAKKRDILLQFLIESLMISLIGGLIGIALGLGVIFGVSEYFKWKMSLDYMSIVLSFVFSSSIGIIFGFYPARKAANLNPIDALRYEYQI
ncbi:MAG: multidrug ABC transporter substrate-binding protein [Actinomycetota bacterium]|nr:MAG: multidrug ABC transporter substrate-binding protein [Actinomycetota bacterium]